VADEQRRPERANDSTLKRRRHRFVGADDGIGQSLVGPAPPNSLKAIANEVRRQAL
jgi:hypothetical protein